MIESFEPTTITDDSFPTIQPWIGQRYFSQNRLGGKVLILGDSMYSFTGEEPIEQSVNLDVERYVLRGERRSFHTKVANIVLNRNGGYLDVASVREAWQEIAFTNFIQAYVGDDCRVPVESSLWRRSERALHDVLGRLRPNLLVVLGARLADRLPVTPGVMRVCIHHPQSSFEYARWNPVVQRAVRGAHEVGS